MNNKKPHVKPLVKPPFRTASSSFNSTPMRRSGSMSSVASTATSHLINPRIPMVPQKSSTMACYKNEHTTRFSIVDGFINFFSRETVMCNCQHPSDTSFLEKMYIKNLQTQIDVLEIENNVLRSGNPKTISRIEETNPRSHSHSEMPSTSGSISYEIPNESGYNSKYEKQRKEYANQQRKHVGFCEPEYSGNSTKYYQTNIEDSNESSQQMYAAHKAKINGSHNGSKHIQKAQDDELFLKLEQSFQNEQKLEEKLKAQLNENRKLFNANAELEDRLRHFENKQSRERRSLLEDNVELQRRLDELTPLLAEKEARISQLEDAKENASARLRSAGIQVASLQAKLDEKKREESFYSEFSTDQKREERKFGEKISQLEREIQERNREIQEFKDREKDLHQDMDEIRHRYHTLEQRISQDRERNHLVIREKDELKEEVLNLKSQIRDYQEQIQQHQAELSTQKRNINHERELMELREIEESLRTELKKTEEQLRHEQNTLKKLEMEAREREVKEEEHRDSRHRTQKELEGLQALSNSLTNENKGLRQEKLALHDQIDHLQIKLKSKEREFNDLAAKLREFRQKYLDSIARLRAEIQRQNETEELELIVQNVQKLADFVVPRQRNQSASSTTSPTQSYSSHGASFQNLFQTSEPVRETSLASLGKSRSSSATRSHQSENTETVSAVRSGYRTISPIMERDTPVLSPLRVEERTIQHSPSYHLYSMDSGILKESQQTDATVETKLSKTGKRQSLTVETSTTKIRHSKEFKSPSELPTTSKSQKSQQQMNKDEQLAIKYRKKLS